MPSEASSTLDDPSANDFRTDSPSIELFDALLSPHTPGGSLSTIYTAGDFEAPENVVRSARQNQALIQAGNPPSRLSQRIGLYLILINIGAFTLLLGCISALTFLWFGDRSNDRWRLIMVDGWVGQAITLSTLAIRLSVAAQAGAATAMLASISMESSRHGGVTLVDAPALSLVRYTNSGPVMTFPTFFRNARSVGRRVLPCVAASLALTTLISQFTSTLLLWDVRSGVLPGLPQSENITTGITMKAFTNRFATSFRKYQNYWTSSAVYPMYAEWNELVVSPTSIVDTGPTIRALLPINSESDRSMLKDFSGMASVFDARVACVRPVISNWSFVEKGDPVYTGSSYSYGNAALKGFIRPSDPSSELEKVLRYNENHPDIPFECFVDDLSAAGTAIKICGLPTSAGGLINSLDPTTNSTLTYKLGYYPENPVLANYPTKWSASSPSSNETWMVDLGHAFLVLQTAPSSIGLGFESNRDLIKFVLQDRDHWVDFIDPAGTKANGKLSVTLCYDAM
jgi:hypothetical protein